LTTIRQTTHLSFSRSSAAEVDGVNELLEQLDHFRLAEFLDPEKTSTPMIARS
jgi:hypothetical protein